MSEGNYGLPDVRLLMAERNAHFLPAIRETPVVVEHLSSDDYHRSLIVAPLPSPHHFDSFSGGVGGMYGATGGGQSSLVDFGHHDSSAASTTTHTGAQAMCGLELESGYNLGNDMGAGNGRWPRQETLTLLEIRSRLDFKFKEANQKGPLWDEVSRIMAEENGYQRSGKKCREKFENLYKYYKKTKEGKAGRQDGKHYRFFRQLEAIYGESSTNNLMNQLQETNLALRNKNMSLLYNHQPPPHLQENQDLAQHSFQEHKIISESQLSFSNNNNLSEFETSSSDNNNNNNDDQDLSTIAFMRSNKEKRVVRRSWKWKVKEFIDLQMKRLMETQEAWMDRMLRAIEEKEKERVWKEEEWRRQEVARVDQEHEFWAKERAWMEARDVALMEALKKITNVNDHNVDMFCDIMNKMKSKDDEETMRTCNYSQKLDLYQDQQEVSRSKRAQENEMMVRLQLQEQEENVGGMNNVVSNSNLGFLHMNNEEMWWDKYGLKLSNEKYQQG